jgi:hypothetical protein
MLSKKYYKILAEIIAISETKQEIAERLTAYFKTDNNRFNAFKFREYINKLENEHGKTITSFSIALKYSFQDVQP